jgi:hypothetical protein
MHAKFSRLVILLVHKILLVHGPCRDIKIGGQLFFSHETFHNAHAEISRHNRNNGARSVHKERLFEVIVNSTN